MRNIGHTKTFRPEQPAEVGEEVVESGLIVQEAEQVASDQPEQVATMVNYDQQNEDDDQNAFSNARDCKLPFNIHDIKLWFSLVESKMQFAGIKKQWSKRQVLIQLIPPEYHTDFKHHLQLQEADAGAAAYYDLKKAILKKFGHKRADNFDKAIARVMTSSPSHLGNQIVGDICPSVRPLTGCHCADVVLGIWRRSLPVAVRNAIADMEFDAANYMAVFDRADSVWSSNAASTSVVSALTKASAAEVAAVSTPRGGQRGGRGNRGGRGGRGGGSGRGGANQGKGRGPRHADGPPDQACSLHWKFGKSAWVCADKHKCPWRDYESPRPSHNRNIVSSAEITNIED